MIASANFKRMPHDEFASRRIVAHGDANVRASGIFRKHYRFGKSPRHVAFDFSAVLIFRLRKQHAYFVDLHQAITQARQIFLCWLAQPKSQCVVANHDNIAVLGRAAGCDFTTGENLPTFFAELGF